MGCMLRWPARLAAGLAAVSLLAGCALLQRQVSTPEILLNEVTLLEVGLLRQRFRVGIEIRNPNGFDLPIREIRYNIHLEDTELAEGRTTKSLTVPANGSTEAEIEMTTRVTSFASHAERWLQSAQDGLDYRITGSVATDLAFGGRLEFSREGRVPFLQ